MKKMALAIGVLALAAFPALATEENGSGNEFAVEAAPAVELGTPAPVVGDETKSGRVARAGFTTAIIDREPQDSLTRLRNDAQEVHFFTELRDLTGHDLVHVWERDGVVVARVPFTVQGPRWRVYSTKRLQPAWLGEWTVKVVDQQQTVLATERFELVAAPAAGSVTATEPEPMREATAAEDPEEAASVIRFDERYRDSAVPAAMD